MPKAFHVYSLRQAIEEGFILDVLQNFTTYKLAFRLANNGKEYDETEVERSAAVKGIMRWVRLHPYNIAQKVQIVVEHFLENVQPLLVVTPRPWSSRAVAWRRYAGSLRCRSTSVSSDDLSALVAFSGEVNDKDSSDEPLS